jgi:hypothetical protein
MTHPSPSEASVLLILGEVKGDVKNILSTLIGYDLRLNTLEDTVDLRFSKLETRVKTLEDLKLRVGAMAFGAGIASGLMGPTILPTILKFLGVM